MLRITHSINAAGAAKYFEEGMTLGDYLSTGQKVIGEWGGEGAKMLGLSGDVRKKDFVNLCHNQNPLSGEQLNPRHSDKRRVGFDLTFSVSKSTSLIYSITGDERIREAFEKSVHETMQEIERTEMRTQKGQSKEKHYPKTENMVWAAFTHRTSRPVNGIPDPHLHRHCFAFNTTWNEEKQRFQAGEFSTIKKKAPYFEAAFNARMAKRMEDLGYSIDRRGYSWEISGIDHTIISKFSRRTEEVEKLAKKQEEKSGKLTAKQKEKLGALTRAKKIASQSWESLKEIWKSWLTDDEARKVEKAKGQSFKDEKKMETKITSSEAVDRALDHLLERKSVSRLYQIKAEALKRSYGNLLPENIEDEIKRRELHREDRNYMTLVTTEKAVQEEHRMLAYVREGKGTKDALNASYEPKTDFLNEEQKRAVRHTLNDTNSVMIVSGGAGVGKTTLVKEIRDGIEEKGIPFLGFAPSAAASRGVMREEGFQKADTLASLLVNPKVQEQTKGAVIWVDEAGLIGNKDMNRLFEIAKQQKARILLTGDVKQHSAVNAGDALRILEKEGGINVARVNKIQRQRNNPMFKHVVSLTSKGEVDSALLHLDRMGGVLEIDDKKTREQALVNDYVQAAKDKKTALIVSPTHSEGNQVTIALRKELQELNLLDKKERSFLQLKNTNQTIENKSDARNYFNPENNLVVEFHQNAKDGHKKGDRWFVDSAHTKNDAVVATKNVEDRGELLPLSHSDRFTVYRQNEISLAKGDKIRITKGGKTQEGTRIYNGNVFTIKDFTKEGHEKQ